MSAKKILGFLLIVKGLFLLILYFSVTGAVIGTNANTNAGSIIGIAMFFLGLTIVALTKD